MNNLKKHYEKLSDIIDILSPALDDLDDVLNDTMSDIRANQNRTDSEDNILGIINEEYLMIPTSRHLEDMLEHIKFNIDIE